MANLYGVSNPAFGINYAQLGTGDIAVPPNVITPIITTSFNLVAPSQGYFYAMLWGVLTVTLGASVPTG